MLTALLYVGHETRSHQHGGSPGEHGARLTYASKDEPIRIQACTQHAHARIHARGINESRQLALASRRRRAFYRAAGAAFPPRGGKIEVPAPVIDRRSSDRHRGRKGKWGERFTGGRSLPPPRRRRFTPSDARGNSLRGIPP